MFTYNPPAPYRGDAVGEPDLGLDAENDPQTHAEHPQKDVKSRGTEDQNQVPSGHAEGRNVTTDLVNGKSRPLKHREKT